MGVLARAIHKYRTDGLAGLIAVGSRLVAAPGPLALKLAVDARVPTVTRADLERRHAGATYWHYSTGDRTALDAPAGNAPLPHEIKCVLGTYRVERPFVCVLDEATLLGPDALARTAENEFVLETTLARRDALEASLLENPGLLRNTVVRPEAADPEAEFDTVCSLVDVYAGSYSHWVLNALPRLEGVERYRVETGERPTLLVPTDPPSWMTDSLALLGYGEETWRWWSDRRARVRRLVVPSCRSVESTQSYYDHRLRYDLRYKYTAPSACAWLRQRALEALSVDEPNARRLIVSRSDADERRMTNRDAVVSALEALGFESYVLSELTFAEQVRLFADAEIVVAPHGAGLANLAFSKDCTVIELFGSKIKPTYFMLAASLGFEYRYVVCAAADVDLIVDIDDLRNALAAAGIDT